MLQHNTKKLISEVNKRVKQPAEEIAPRKVTHTSSRQKTCSVLVIQYVRHWKKASSTAILLQINLD